MRLRSRVRVPTVVTKRLSIRFAVLLLASASAAYGQVQLGILDDFEGGPEACLTDNWQEGNQSPNPPTGILLCGELDSCCLEANSSGGFGPGSRQVVYNQSQWTGDYRAAGVNKIQMQLANASATETLNVRVGVSNGTSCYVSTAPVALPPNRPGPFGLILANFILDNSTMTSVSGNECSNPGQDDLETVLSNVTQLRVLSSSSPAWNGDAVVSTMQIDAVQSMADSDFDGVNDDVDNCTDVANPSQLDTNGDGYGNVCDPDLNNDCIVNFVDLGALKSAFFSTPGSPNWDPDADFDGNLVVNFLDLSRMKSVFFAEPGPGQGACGACLPPDPLGTNADFAGLPMFVRGGLVADWGAVAGLNSFSDQTGGSYVARFEANAGSYEWKIADEGWSIEYCTTTNLGQGTPTNAPLFGCAFPSNGTVDIPATGCYEFQMQTDGSVPPNSVDVTFTPAP